MSKYKKLLKELEYIEDVKDNNLVKNLLQIPKKDKGFQAAHTICPTPQYIYQVDVLFLPDDNGYKYLLVAVDIATGKCDAEPLKDKSSKVVRNALTAIYKRNNLDLPHEIEVDAGTEFKDDFDKHFDKVSHVRHKKSCRHRAQAVVEGVNSLISKLLQTRMLSEEMNTGETSVEWVDEVPNVIKALNKNFAHTPPKTDVKTHIPIKVKKGTVAVDVLEIGTAVRIQLDNPVDAVASKRLHGKFRLGDIHWENKVRKVTQVYLRPDFPPMYEIYDDENVAYTRNQLQPVKSNEKKPPKKL